MPLFFRMKKSYNVGMKANDKIIKRLALHGIFLSVIAMLTLFASVPLPMGSGGAYLNAGDAAIYAAAYVLGPAGGAVTAALGSALADMLHGAMVYAPVTLVIKGLMGLIAGLLFKRLRLGSLPIAGLVMPAGYFAFERILYGSGTALFGLWTNAIQYAFGVAAGILLIAALGRTKAITPYFPPRTKHGTKESICRAGVTILERGLTSGTGGNISVFDRKAGLVYITPTTMPYHDITAEDIPVFRLDGAPVEEPRKPSMELHMHLNIYRSRPDVSAVVHTHSPALIEMGGAEGEAMGLPISPVYPVGSAELAAGCAEHLKDAPCVLLKGHGAVFVGKDLDEALNRALDYERNAEEALRG